MISAGGVGTASTGDVDTKAVVGWGAKGDAAMVGDAGTGVGGVPTKCWHPAARGMGIDATRICIPMRQPVDAFISSSLPSRQDAP
jgi:hypothetical protein